MLETRAEKTHTKNSNAVSEIEREKKMHKTLKRYFWENIYIFFGIILGIYISLFFSDNLDSNQSCQISPNIRNETAQRIIRSSVNNLIPPVVTEKPSANAKKPKLIRPRYYSTELGIREKLFVGVFSSEERVNTVAVHVNKTAGHLVDKIKFFITAQYKLKTKLNLTGLVGFTDARSKYRPFQVVKYVGDTYGNDYDFYFFINDYTYTNAHKLRDILNKISVSADLYFGKKISDGSYCDLNAGIILSNSVLKAMRQHLEWCIINSVSEDNSENIGRCVYHSLGLNCQEKVQGQRLSSFKLKHFDLSDRLLELSQRESFNNAIVVYPILQKDDFYLLNAYFLKQRLSDIHAKIDVLSDNLDGSDWPPGQRTGAKPATRFDLLHQRYFNMTHVFFPDDFTIIRRHTEAETIDIENVLDEIKQKVGEKHLEYRRLVNGYKTFDLSRGMDYVFDLGFRDLNTGKEIIKRFEVCKPLGNVELIQVPYVTENSRVTILLPIQENEINLALNFIAHYVATIMERKEKSVLLLTFLYQSESSSKGDDDVFRRIKEAALKSAAKSKNDDVKITWVSIRLPSSKSKLTLEENDILNLAVVDLCLKKVGPENLLLLLNVYTNITADFLNRVRMNTIEHFQIFSPIPFKQYEPKISGITTSEVNKLAGHFNREDYTFVAFYGSDYVGARRGQRRRVPLVRVDGDIAELLKSGGGGNLFEMFVRFGGENLSCMRAPDAGLRVRHRPDDTFFGTEAQIAKLLLANRDVVREL